MSLALQFSPEQVLAQGRATFTGSNDAEPLVAGWRRDEVSPDPDGDGFTLTNGEEPGYLNFDDHSVGGTYPELDSDIHPDIVSQIGGNDFTVSFSLDPDSAPLEQQTTAEGQRWGIYLQFDNGVSNGGSDVIFGFDPQSQTGPPGNRPWAEVIGLALAPWYYTYYIDFFDATGTAETLTLKRTGDVYTMSTSSRNANFTAVCGFAGGGTSCGDFQQGKKVDLNSENGIGQGAMLTHLTFWTESTNGPTFPEDAAQFDRLVIESPGITTDINMRLAAVVTRDIQPLRSPAEICGDFRPGDVIPVSLTLSDVREARGPFPAPTDATVREQPPAGWAVTEISAPGTLVGGAIEWNLDGNSLVDGTTLTYSVTATDIPDATWEGALTENGAVPIPVGGETAIRGDDPFDECGGIRCWNILGPFTQTGFWGGVLIREDFMTDGIVGETNFVWGPGKEIATDFGGEAASFGVNPDLHGRNPGGVPTVFPWTDDGGWVNYYDDVFGGDQNGTMAYAQIYVVAESELEVFMAISSDDSVQVLLNGEEVWINNVGRAGSNDACAPQDLADPVFLNEGQNSLIVKTFNGLSGFNFTFRFEDVSGQPITEGIELSRSPVSCATSAVTAVRTITSSSTVPLQSVGRPRWENGETIDVSIAVSDPRAAAGACAAATAVRIEETVPPDWFVDAGSVSGGGVVAGQTITWTLDPVAPVTLSYQVEAGGELLAGGNGDVLFDGRVFDMTPDAGLVSGVAGDRSLFNPDPFSDCGGIRLWNMLGPYRTGVFDPGIDVMNLDFLSDGTVGESEFVWEPGKEINTDFSLGASTGLITPDPFNRNPDGVPTVFEWWDFDDWINPNDEAFGANPDLAMVYAQVYVIAEEEMAVAMGISDDDKVQVILNGEVVFTSTDLGGGASACVPQHSSLDLFGGQDLQILNKGQNSLIVKTFEAVGGFNFAVRFQDEDGFEGITEGLTLRTTPLPDGPPPIRFRRGDCNDDGLVNISDGVCILGWLFAGDETPGCIAATNANGDSTTNISDATYLLNHLFSGGPALAQPFPDCGTSELEADVEQGCEIGCQ